MTQRKAQKVFYYSSNENRFLIDARLDELSKQTGKTTSYLIEQILLDGLLPENSQAQFFIRECLYNEMDNECIKSTITNLFSFNSAGIDWMPIYDNFLPLLEYCIKFCPRPARSQKNNDFIFSYLSCFKSVVDHIEKYSHYCIEPECRQIFELAAEMAKSMLKRAEEDNCSINFLEQYELVYKCWDMLHDWSVTYEYLSYLTTISSNWPEDVNAKNTLYNVISNLSKSWK